MITPEAIAEARRQLGRQLAALRKAAGYSSQHDLAPLTFYGRSTIANVETGRQHAGRAFWQRCDEVLAAGADEAIDVAAAGEVAFRWLVASRDRLATQGVSRHRVGRSDVERLRAVRRTLKAVDNAHGGGAALPMAIAYLRREVRPLLDGRYDDGTSAALFGVTAELMLDVGWMAYDNANHRLAADYMGHALRLSHAANDRLLGGRVLAAMSHQALHLRQVRLSVDLVRAARVGTQRIVTPRALAMFAAMEAMAQ